MIKILGIIEWAMFGFCYCIGYFTAVWIHKIELVKNEEFIRIEEEDW